MRLDLPVLEPEEMSRDELIVVVRAQAGQISAQAVQIAELMEANEALADRLARLEHLLSRNSGNSSNPPSKDDDPGKPAPPDKQRGRGGPQRSRGKQRGAPGTHLAWTDTPNAQQDRFPEGRCDCGHDLAGARDLGVVDRYQRRCQMVCVRPEPRLRSNTDSCLPTRDTRWVSPKRRSHARPGRRSTTCSMPGCSMS